MEEDLNNTDANNSPYIKEPEAEKSFVGKFKEIISNTPLSKWFRKQNDSGSTVRRRDDSTDDDELYSLQPPTKRSKLPTESVFNDGLSPISSISNSSTIFNDGLSSASPVTTKNCLNNISNKVLYTNNFPEPVAGPSGINTRKLHNVSVSTSISNVSNTFRSKISEVNIRNKSNKTDEVSRSSKNYGKINKDFVNANKDSDSEESTSGYSSVARIGSKEQVCESQESSKQASPLESSPNKARSLFQTSGTTTTTCRSLFTERSLSPKMNSSLSSRRPCFNTSAFSSPDNLTEKSALETSRRIVNSPFYSGRTIYGGASAYGGRHLNRSSQDLSASLRNSVIIKPVNHKTSENGNALLGKTARRILDTLEQYSSPVNDAKKIPVSTRKIRKDGMVGKYIGANPYLIRDAVKTASNKELQVPSVSDLLKMKQNLQKSRLQDSTESIRQLATQSTSTLNSENYKIPTENDQQEKHTGKIKTRITSIRPNKVQLEENSRYNEALVLNPMALPIKKLPQFDFGGPPKPNDTSVSDEVKDKPIGNIQSLFTPAPFKTDTSNKRTETITSFTIQQTLIRKKTDLELTGDADHTIQTNNNNNNKNGNKNNGNSNNNVGNSNNIGSNSNNNNGGNSNNNGGNSRNNDGNSHKNNDNGNNNNNGNSNNNNGSSNSNNGNRTVLEFKFSAPIVLAENIKAIVAANNFKFSEPLCKRRKSSGGSENISNKVMAELQKTKNNGETASKLPSLFNRLPKKDEQKSFMEKFKPAQGTWECPTCMIRNQPEKLKCVACETPRTTATSKDSSKTSVLDNKPTLPAPLTSGFGDKFKAPAGTWECAACMVRNKSDVTKCAACETPKPGDSGGGKTALASDVSSGFGMKFAPPLSTWECDTCMIRNKEEITKCEACQTPRPGNGPPKPPTFPIQTTGSSFGSNFKIKDDQWECSACMVRNKSNLEKCQCCETPKPGGGSASGTQSSLTGTSASNIGKSTTTFSFGIDKTVASSFNFGIPPGLNQSLIDCNSKTPNKTTGIAPSAVFGNAANNSSKKFGSNTGDGSLIKFGSSSVVSAPSVTSSAITTTPVTSSVVSSTLSATSVQSSFKFGLPTKTDDAVKSVAGEQQNKTVVDASARKIEDGSNNKNDKVGSSSSEKKIGTTWQQGNPLLKPGEKLPEKVVPAGAGFTFGLAAASPRSTTPNTSSTPSTAMTSPIPSQSPSTKASLTGNNVASSSLSTSTTSSNVPMFNFGLAKPQTAVTVTPTSNLGFGISNKPSATSASSTLGTGFGSNKLLPVTSATSTNIRFGSPNKPEVMTSSSTTLTFGTSNKSVVTSSASGVATLPCAALAASNSGSGVAKPMFNYTFKSTNPPKFGTISSTTPSAVPVVPPTLGGFGSTNSASTASNGPPSGGHGIFSTSTAPSGSNIFGGSAMTNSNSSAGSAQQVKPFSFGVAPAAAQTTELTTKIPSFSFGASAPANQTQPEQSGPGGFNFGATSTPVNNFSFGAPVPKPPTAASINHHAHLAQPTFGTPPQQTNQSASNIFGSASGAAQPAAQNGLFNFGSGTTTGGTQKAGFSFGVAAAANSGSGGNPQQQGSVGGFNFGGPLTASPAPGSFNFPAPAPPAFDANAKPSFNFSGGNNVTTFSSALSAKCVFCECDKKGKNSPEAKSSPKYRYTAMPVSFK